MANSKTTTTLSRRSTLVGLASAAAVAIPATALAASAEPDAALLDLGKTLAQLIDEYHELQEQHETIEAAWVPPDRPDILRVSGYDLFPHGSPVPESGETVWFKSEIFDALSQSRDMPTAMARLRELKQASADYDAVFLAARRDCGADAAAEALEDAGIRIDAVTDEMRALRATTLQGFAVKAMAVAFHATHLWTKEEDDLDWHEHVIREFVDEAVNHLPEAIAA